ncbi:hypothetical protein CR513_51900, partial [Mucuna pruriens]
MLVFGVHVGIWDFIDQHDKVRDLMHSLSSTLIMHFSSMKLTKTRGMCDHIMRIRDVVGQLNGLEVIMSESFLIHYILCTLPHQYALSRSLTIYTKINGQLMSY